MGLFNLFNNKKSETRSSSADTLVGFILFISKQIDWDAFNTNLDKDWEIKISEKPTASGQLVFEFDEMMVACGFVETTVPNNEAEDIAKNNFQWKEAVQVTGTHKAHVILSVMRGTNAIERNLFLQK